MGMVGVGAVSPKCVLILTKIRCNPRKHCRRGAIHHANITRATLAD